jgi:hypothetical protein
MELRRAGCELRCWEGGKCRHDDDDDATRGRKNSPLGFGFEQLTNWTAGLCFVCRLGRRVFRAGRTKKR